MDKNDVTIVGFFATEDGPSFEAYSDASEMLREVDNRLFHLSITDL